MTYILVSGYRNPYLTAKAAASFDLLSGGRFTLGTGAGYLKAEFGALGADFDRRGALLDEAIAAWKATWAGIDHDGPEFGVERHVALPPPLATGGPPIWIGGNGAAAQRRRRRRWLDADGGVGRDGRDHPRPPPRRHRHAWRLGLDGEQATGPNR